MKARPLRAGRSIPGIVVAVILTTAFLGGLGESAVGAERCVLIEDFCATWCIPCHDTGNWLGEMQDLYPETIALLQVHVSATDVYAIPWGKSRFGSYPPDPNIGYALVPTAWYDGALRLVGADPNYAGFLAAYEARRATPTDVTVELGAEPMGGQVFKFKVRVGVPTTGTAKPVWVYIARALDNYPPGQTYYRNCLMEGANAGEIQLQPGERETVEYTMTFDAASWSQQNDIRVLAWVQVPGNSGSREVYQAKMIAWPLPPLYPVGDGNCDSSINYGDINPFVKALQGRSSYELEYPYCAWLNADCDGDGTVGYGDINDFVHLLNPGPR